MKKIITLLSLSGFCMMCPRAYAGDDNPTPAVKSTVRINYQNHPVNNSSPLKPENASDIRAAFLFTENAQPDALKNMTLRSAVAGAGIMGAIMGGRIAAKFWINSHLCFAPGIDIGSKRADFRLTF